MPSQVHVIIEITIIFLLGLQECFAVNSIVDIDGDGNYRSVQEALDNAPLNSQSRYVILVRPGIYREKVHINSSMVNITLKGEGAEVTQIHWNDTAETMHLAETATVSIEGEDFVAKNISFHNTANPKPSMKSQNVAVKASGDRMAFYGCGFHGYQDTLLDSWGRHYFKQCYINGTVDFICGDGQSIYEECHIDAVSPLSTSATGSIAAQARSSTNSPTGFTFLRCNITGTGNVLLGRAWGDYSRVIYASSYMSGVINPIGWDAWNDVSHNTSFFGEYNCSGPGANRTDRVRWSHPLNQYTAKHFIQSDFINAKHWLEYDI